MNNTIEGVYDGLIESVRRVDNFPKPESQIKEQVVYDLKNESRELIRVGDCFQSNEGYVVKVLEYVNKTNVCVEFQDSNKARCWFRTTNLRSGKFKNPYHKSVFGVGYLGEGLHRCSKDSKLTVTYVIWNSMLRRCYSEVYLKGKPSYIGCTVCEDWHNFQVFAGWFEKVFYYTAGWELDKDILYTGNKVYSPKTCCFVPKEVNSIFTKVSANKEKKPIGVKNTKSGKFYCVCNWRNKRKSLGVFDTREGAEASYIKEKVRLMLNISAIYENTLDPRVIEKLKCFDPVAHYTHYKGD